MFEIPQHDDCPFCRYLSGADSCAFVTRDENVAGFLNRAQFERGALLLVPIAHRESILELEPQLLSSLYLETQRIAKGMVKAFGAVGLNIFQTNGLRAGQSVSHYHIHIVPRYGTSLPWVRFQEGDFEKASLEELEIVAQELREALTNVA